MSTDQNPTPTENGEEPKIFGESAKKFFNPAISGDATGNNDQANPDADARARARRTKPGIRHKVPVRRRRQIRLFGTSGASGVYRLVVAAHFR